MLFKKDKDRLRRVEERLCDLARRLESVKYIHVGYGRKVPVQDVIELLLDRYSLEIKQIPGRAERFELVEKRDE